MKEMAACRINRYCHTQVQPSHSPSVLTEKVSILHRRETQPIHISPVFITRDGYNCTTKRQCKTVSKQSNNKLHDI